MKLQVTAGTTSKKLNVFVQDVTATTGVGLANVLGSSVSYTWCRDDATGVTTGTASTAGSLGIFSTSAWVQLSSANALGWYQFGAPNGMFVSGQSVVLHMYGAPNMVVVPMELEIIRQDLQQFSSSTVFLAYTSTSPSNITQIQGANAVTSAAGVLSVDVDSIQGSNAVTTAAGILSTDNRSVHGSSIVTTAAGIMSTDNRSIHGSATVTSAAGVQSTDNRSIFGQTTVTTAAGRISVDVGTIRTSNAVTSAAGILNVSTQTIDKTGYDVTSFYGSAAVTSDAGILNVSTQTLAAAGSDIQTVHGSPIVTSAAGVFGVDILTILGATPTTSGAGRLNVSTQSLAGIVVSTQTIDKTGYSLTAGERASIAGVVLTTTQPESYRGINDTGSVMQLMYEVLANVTEMSNSGTTRALNSVTSHAVSGLEYQYDSSSAPSSITRVS